MPHRPTRRPTICCPALLPLPHPDPSPRVDSPDPPPRLLPPNTIDAVLLTAAALPPDHPHALGDVLRGSAGAERDGDGEGGGGKAGGGLDRDEKQREREREKEKDFINGILKSPSLGWKLKRRVLPSASSSVWMGRGRRRRRGRSARKLLGEGKEGREEGSLVGFDDDARVLGEGDLEVGLFLQEEEDGSGDGEEAVGCAEKGDAEGEGSARSHHHHLKLPSRVVQEGDFGRSVFGSLSAEWWRPMFSRFDLIPSFFFFGCLLSLSLAFFRSSVPGVLPLAFTFRVLIRDSQTVFFSRDKI